MRWPWQREPTNEAYTPVDALAAAYLHPYGVDIAGVAVNETTATGLSGFYRAASLISGTLASIPLRSLREDENGRPKRVTSIFDNPDGDEGQTAYEWKETLFLHLLLHGNAFALKTFNQAGSLIRLPLVHPLSVQIEPPSAHDHRTGNLPVGGKWFTVSLIDGTRTRLDATDVWHVPAMSLDGVKGIGLIQAARLSLATTLAGDKAAGNMFSRGAMISGLATPADDEDITDDVPEIRRQLNNSTSGVSNAGSIAIVNRRLTFTPWTMTMADAQFLQSRQFQIEEIARWTGVPPHLLMQTEKQTSWGTGVDEQNRGLSKFVLGHWANRVEQRGSRLLQRPRWIEFDFAGLERPNFATEIDLLIKQVNAGILTVNEAREIRNLPPLPEATASVTGNGGAEGDDDAPPSE